MTNYQAYVLVSHGSRDSRPQLAMLRLAEQLGQKLSQEYGSENRIYNSENSTVLTKTKPILIETACLELTTIPLHQKIIDFAKLSLNSGINELKIIPLFLANGVHVREDIPLQVSLAEEKLQEKIKISLQPYLGSNFRLQNFLEQEFNRLNCEGNIILAHGSRRVGGNFQIENMAHNLGVLTAYWSVTPALESQIQLLINQGIKTIAILPYFLFHGTITDAIASLIKELQIKYPQVEIKLGETLDRHPNLIELIMDII